MKNQKTYIQYDLFTGAPKRYQRNPAKRRGNGREFQERTGTQRSGVTTSDPNDEPQAPSELRARKKGNQKQNLKFN